MPVDIRTPSSDPGLAIFSSLFRMPYRYLLATVSIVRAPSARREAVHRRRERTDLIRMLSHSKSLPKDCRLKIYVRTPL
jgi:hypothetical protein